MGNLAERLPMMWNFLWTVLQFKTLHLAFLPPLFPSHRSDLPYSRCFPSLPSSFPIFPHGCVPSKTSCIWHLLLWGRTPTDTVEKMLDGTDKTFGFPVSSASLLWSPVQGLWLKGALWAGRRSVPTDLSSAKFHIGYGPHLPGALVDPQCQAHMHCPIKNSGMNSTFTTSNYFLSADLFIICLPTRWQLPGGGWCLSLSLLHRTPVASSVPGTGKILNTYLANELMNKLIVWSSAKPILLWELWFSHGKWGMDRSRQFLNGK